MRNPGLEIPRDVLIIGAGPSGLSAAYRLTQGGVRPTVVEKEGHVGGLMRSVRRGEFILDIGRKELYTRIADADGFWRDILGEDYREYSHRVGSLYGGRILEMSRRYRGWRRGVPWSWLLLGGLDLARSWASVTSSANYEQYWHKRAGRKFSKLFAQGYWEKFRGIPWAVMEVPETDVDGTPTNSYFYNAVRQGLKLASRGTPVTQEQWRHPAKGTGQVWEQVKRIIQEEGAEIRFGSEVEDIEISDGRIIRVHVRCRGERISYLPKHVVSGLQIEQLLAITSGIKLEEASELNSSDQQRHVVLVYLFLNEEPRFPHAWLEVNDTSMNAGRITNYKAFNGDMVPPGKTCLCVEFFLSGQDEMLRMDSDELRAIAVEECVQNGLIDPTVLFDAFVLYLKRSNAAASWRDWQSRAKLDALKRIQKIGNLYHANRPGADWATFAGLMAGEAILNGCRSEFDRRTDPTKRYALSNHPAGGSRAALVVKSDD